MVVLTSEEQRIGVFDQLQNALVRKYQKLVFWGDFRVRTAQERVGRSKKFLYRIERFSMIELFKEAFSEILSEKKVDWVRKSGQNAQIPRF